jgi:hypothetical protein
MRRPGWTFNIKDKIRVYPDRTRIIEKEITTWLHNNTSGYYDYNFPELYVFLENSEDAMIFKLKFGEYIESV